jgi:hydroxyethylthiazole kinase-like uncharacterized protein yjeF
MNILSAAQIKEADQYTIANEPIASIDLMERAAMACVRRLVKLIDDHTKVYVACGCGNNGGDGLAISRLLLERGYEVETIIIFSKDVLSPDAQLNHEKLKEKNLARIHEIKKIEELKSFSFEQPSVLIDALLGTGLKGKVEGLLSECIHIFNAMFRNTISIDVPSGLNCDEITLEKDAVIESALTLSLQLPKLAFLLPENEEFVPAFEIIDIGLSEEAIVRSKSAFHYLAKYEISALLKKRNKFEHKGNFGHALLLAGSKDKPGAALISSRATLRSGAGLLTVHSVKNVLDAMIVQTPEAMCEHDENNEHITTLIKPENYDAIGIGPGIGTHEDSQNVLKKLLNYYKGKLVIDADALNILAENKTWLSFLPPNSILTPHPKEFERLAGKSDNDLDRLKNLKEFSIKHHCIVILKGAHSAVAMPDGNIFFNSTGNSGLSKAGSGDGLTGIILGLLARGYNAPQSAIIGTFVHGYAADLLVKKKSMESILISDVIENLPKAFRKLEV